MGEIILCVSMVAIVSALFKLLVPDGGFKKQIAFLVACFFAVSCVTFFRGGGADLSELSDSLRGQGGYVDFSAEAYRQTQEEIARNLSGELKSLLAEREIYPDEIYIIIDISGSYSISIKQIRLVFSAENARIATAELIVREEVGDEVQIVSEIKGR